MNHRSGTSFTDLKEYVTLYVFFVSQVLEIVVTNGVFQIYDLQASRALKMITIGIRCRVGMRVQLRD